MPKTYFCVASYYGGYAGLSAHLKSLPNNSYSTLINEQFGPDREIMGFARVYNILVNAAFADPVCKYVWIMGDDVLPVGNCLAETQTVIEFDTTIGVVFPMENIQHGLDYSKSEQLFATFACVCIRREAWEKVGPMDETIGRGYAEDLDWGLRCWKAGFRVVQYRREWYHHTKGTTYNMLVKEGKYAPSEPYDAADKVKARYPFLWSGESDESIIAKIRTDK